MNSFSLSSIFFLWSSKQTYPEPYLKEQRKRKTPPNRSKMREVFRRKSLSGTRALVGGCILLEYMHHLIVVNLIPSFLADWFVRMFITWMFIVYFQELGVSRSLLGDEAPESGRDHWNPGEVVDFYMWQYIFFILLDVTRIRFFHSYTLADKDTHANVAREQSSLFLWWNWMS